MRCGMARYDAAAVGGRMYVTEGWTWPFSFSPRGGVYDADRDAWEEMSAGMREGWTGASAVVGGRIFVVSDYGDGRVKAYDSGSDGWRAVRGGGVPPELRRPYAVSGAEGPADEFSFSLALKACSRISSLRNGSQIHSLILKSLFSSNIYLQNSLIAFDAKCGLGELARRVFDRIPHHDAVSWNSMIDGYVKNGKLDSAMELFDGMGDAVKKLVTWNSIISGFASSIDGIDIAHGLFDRMPERDSISWNLMIDGYTKCGRLIDAMDLFDRMPNKDVISWTNLIAGHMEARSVEQARRLFDEMLERDVISSARPPAGSLSFVLL